MGNSSKDSRSVVIGIYTYEDQHRLVNTIGSLKANTTLDYELILLLDGPGDELEKFVNKLNNVRKFVNKDAKGAAACFNTLCTLTESDIIVFLEDGCKVGPDWLEQIFIVLDSDTSHGIAGPSTNLSWNEQCVFPGSSDSEDAIAITAAEAKNLFGTTWTTLKPLYSLADFCYVVRREVIDSIGAADESYDRGPCWEMDYNIRAARVGFQGVWARGAYVHRCGFTSRRTKDEAELMNVSKRIFQRKFCERQKNNNSAIFRSHCRGDDCSNFAKLSRTETKLPFNTETQSNSENNLSSSISSEWPLVSCIMPTANRRTFLKYSIQCFQQQDYPRLELLVVDDGDEPVEDGIPDDPRIRYIRLNNKYILGKKRNLACEKSRGEIIVHWDDDDWYPAWRVSAQVSALLENRAKVCGTSSLYYRNTLKKLAWKYSYPHSSWVAGNTLAYTKTFWQSNPFPEIQIGEDARFVSKVEKKDLIDLSNPILCIAAVHESNTSPKRCHDEYWKELAYLEICRLQDQQLEKIDKKSDLITCIMPTYNRRKYILLSLENFFAQTYLNKELVIVDDGTDKVDDLLKDFKDIRYISLTNHLSIGEKRNIACENARGEIIAHWDDDDWYGPERLALQVHPILADEADITGLENRYTMVLPDGQFWQTDPELHRRMFVGDVHGGTLMFRKSIWSNGIRYENVDLAEDAAFLTAAQRNGARLMRIDNHGCFVYMRHSHNAWKFDPGQFLEPNRWYQTSAPSNFELEIQARYKFAATNRASSLV